MTGAAPAARRILAQARFELATILRNGEQLLVTFALPALILVVLSTTTILGEATIQQVFPGVLAVAVMGSAFTSQAVATAFDRRSGVLRLLATTPLGRGGLVVGKVLAVLGVLALQVVALWGLAAALGFRPAGPWVWWTPVLLILGAAAFGTLGLWLAGTLRAEGVLAVANLIWVVLLLFGGVLWPVSRLPGWLASVAQFLPSGALGEGLRAALGGTGGFFAQAPLSGNTLAAGLSATSSPAIAALVLAAWAVVGSFGAVRSFRWE